MRERGFTLMEVLITAAIVGTLASIAMPLSEVVAQRSRETDLRRALREIRDALDAYKRASDEGRIQRSPAESGYPPDLEALVQGVADARSPGGAKIYFLRRLPRDPMFADDAVPAAQTWGTRSYESPPGEPRPGKDVFDVYSLNPRIGLNGVPYRKW